MPIIKEISCRSILNPSNLGGEVKYSVNPYVGCQHGCLYCYAVFMRRHTGHREEWGDFVDAKVNAPTLLAKEASRRQRGLVFISSVTDAYQPAERRYELTRRCLEQLLKYRYPIEILTKSALVTRDADLFAKSPGCRVGFTIAMIDENARREFEPNSSSIDERFAALEELHIRGIETWIFLGPILPRVTDSGDGLEELVRRAARAGTELIMIDRLNMKPDMTPRFMKFIREKRPDLLSEYEKILFSRDNYFQDRKSRIIKICGEMGVKAESCF